MNDVVVAAVKKNSREEIRVTLGQFNGRAVFSARVWFDAGDGDMRPSKTGITFAMDRLPDFADAVCLALAEARRKGELPFEPS